MIKDNYFVINDIYSNILSWNIIEKNGQCCLTLGLMHPFLGMHDGLEHTACLLTTDTGDQVRVLT